MNNLMATVLLKGVQFSFHFIISQQTYGPTVLGLDSGFTLNPKRSIDFRI